MLGQILAAQKRLQEESFGFNFDTMTDEEKITFITWNTLAMTDELHEALAETGWKPWASSKHINRKEFVGELIDALHFLANLFVVVGASEEEILERYKAKRDVNAKRQAEGYDGVSTKDPITGRALDEPA